VARRTFFSFHYEPDVRRAWVVRNSWVTKVAQHEREDAGFFDSSVFEAAQRDGEENLKRFLREGLYNTTVTCVLVGTHTCVRRWVRYELLRSFMRGNGLFAIRINSISDMKSGPSAAGGNPFGVLAFTLDGDRVKFKEYMTNGWQPARDVPTMPLSDVAYSLGQRTNHTFSTLFPIYDWTANEGYKNVGGWIEAAARTAGK
jgi:hypothetical protein